MCVWHYGCGFIAHVWMIRPTVHTLIHSVWHHSTYMNDSTHSTHPHTFMYPHADVSFPSGDDVEYALVYWKVLSLYMFVYGGARLIWCRHPRCTPWEKWVCVTSLIHVCHDSTISDTTRSHVPKQLPDAGPREVLRERSGYVSHDSFICAMTQPIWRDSFTCAKTVTWCRPPWSTPWEKWVCVTWLIHMCHDSSTSDVTLLHVPR